MQNPIEIENIEEMRLQVGIDDVELREEIRTLKVGTFVRLTLLTGPKSCGETLLVQITAIRGSSFHGKLASRPTSACLSDLLAGSPIAFTRAHIHSLPHKRFSHV